jgi:uncharacterized protein (DUF488 family)
MMKAMPAHLSIWTVGHSNHDIDHFAQLVSSEQVEFLADVRSYPYSRFAPQFNRDELEGTMDRHGVGYLFLGEELGGRPTRDEHYDADGHALYGPMSEVKAFADAIERLIAGAQRYRIALVCSEGDPQHCHRRLLVGKVLTERGIELRHILTDGTIRTERSVQPAEDAQFTLLEDEQTPWRSTQSVSHRRRLSASSSA